MMMEMGQLHAVQCAKQYAKKLMRIKQTNTLPERHNNRSVPTGSSSSFTTVNQNSNHSASTLRGTTDFSATKRNINNAITKRTTPLKSMTPRFISHPNGTVLRTTHPQPKPINIIDSNGDEDGDR